MDSYNKYRVSEKGRATIAIVQKRARLKLRNAVISILGSICNQCGFSDNRALQIDHINGGGHKERKKINSVPKYYKTIIESVINGEEKYQLLCANCNVIKRIVNQENTSKWL